jgi:hypothetical protein
VLAALKAHFSRIKARATVEQVIRTITESHLLSQYITPDERSNHHIRMTTIHGVGFYRADEFVSNIHDLVIPAPG